MKAAFYERFSGPISIETLDDPVPKDHGVVLKVLATGLCLSDWHGWRGHDADIRLPHVPGHELVGEIFELGSKVKDWKQGDRVTLPFVCGCGSCVTCKQGDPQVCPDQFQPGFTHWGSFAEYVSIQFANSNLVSVPEEISSVTAASLGCRFATSYRGIVAQGKVQLNQTVAVFGCGGVGLSAIMIANALGAQVIAIDVKKGALDKAKQVGAHATILSSDDSRTIEHINDLSNGGVHLTVDAIGHPAVIHNAISVLKRRGRHVQIGLVSPDKKNTAIPMEKVIAYELEIVGSHGMAASQYPAMLDMILQRKLRPDLLIDKTITLEEAIRELPLMDQYAGSGIRVIDQI